ncbi:MAG: nuclear transport factor 2 family protein [Euryarchaeota archaeon]|nr:nuclear transport factor 2 family protein [Euryarchaeota archaeon]
MKLFKKDSTSQRIFRYVEEFQRATQNNDYRAARDAVEKALTIDPGHKELLDMKATVLELIEMQNSREKPPLSDVTHVITQEDKPNVHLSADGCESVETVLKLYGKALIAGDADAAASMWDESSADLTYVSTDYGAVRKGYREIQDALKYEASNYSYMTYAIVEHSKDNANLVYAFYEVRVARLWDAYANIPGCKRVSLVLRKKGNTWKIVHGHESAFSCFS